MFKIVLAGLIIATLILLQPQIVQAAITQVVSSPVVVAQNTIIIQNSQFVPQILQVTPGTTVTWVNQDSISHTTTADNTSAAEVWDSGNIAPGQSFSKTFTQPGTYNYHCKLHPAVKGSIQVVSAGTIVQPAAPVVVVPSNQLPRTGPPLAAYSVIGLIPLGWRLMRYKRLLTENKSGWILWQNRRFKLS